jgi:hypothetical protein
VPTGDGEATLKNLKSEPVKSEEDKNTESMSPPDKLAGETDLGETATAKSEDLNAQEHSEEKKEEVGASDEFLAHNNEVDIKNEQPLSEESDEESINTSAEPTIKNAAEPTDIFEATNKIKTDDVKQVDMPQEAQSAEIPTNNPLNNNLNQQVDNQGLDEI